MIRERTAAAELTPRDASGTEPMASDQAAVGRAEAALRALSVEFAAWLDEDLARLEAAGAALRADPASEAAWSAVQTCGHDLKGVGGMYGRPLVTRACASLGRLLDDPTHRASTPLPVVEAHLRAVPVLAAGEAGPELCAALEDEAAAVLARRA